MSEGVDLANLKATVPLVSICSQIRNQCDMAKEMIASVIAQTYKNWELIIVDDGSTEDLKAVIDSFNDERIKYHRFEENKGIPHGLNHALTLAQGAYIGFLAADEIIHPRKLTDQVLYLQQHEGVHCVWGVGGRGDLGPVDLWQQNALLRAHNRSNEHWLRTLVNLENVPIGGCGLLMRAEVMRDLGGFDPNLTTFSDHELYCRFFERGYKAVVLPVRWAIDRPSSEDTVRFQNRDKAEEELKYVREKHPLKLPKVGGTVTVGIPCHNQGKFLRHCINSVLAQTYTDLDIIVLDDASTDNTRKIMEEIDDPRVRGMAFAENMGVQAGMTEMCFRAKGAFFLMVAADDTIEPNTVEKLMAEYEKNPWLEMVSCQTDFMDKKGRKITDFRKADPFVQALSVIPKPVNRTREEWLDALYPGNHYFGVGMYRVEAISDLGGWKKQAEVISDYEMYLALLTRENIAIVEEPLTHTRVHESNYSRLPPERARKLPKLYARARKPYYIPRMRVVIATPFYELKAFSPYVVSLVQTLRLLTANGVGFSFMEISGDSYVHRARNTICDAFLEDEEATDLFFIDSDMSWNPEAFLKMCLLPQPVLGGSYPVKNKWDAWTSIPKQHEEGGKPALKGVELPDGSALIEAHVLAGGFLRLKRDALVKFREKFPDDNYTEPSTRPDDPERKFTEFFFAGKIDGKFFGEDHYFSMKMRNAGIPMFIFPNVDITHWGYNAFAGNFHKFMRGEQKQGA